MKLFLFCLSFSKVFYTWINGAPVLALFKALLFKALLEIML